VSGKLKKYKIFKKNYLYIFSEPGLFKTDMDYVLKGIINIESKFDKTYDMYFINCIDMIYVLNSKTNSIKEINISSDMLQMIKKESLLEINI